MPRLIVCAVLVIFFSSFSFAQSKVSIDNELNLQRIYKQHAQASDDAGERVVALANRNCADLHATAAEYIMKTPSRARAISKKVQKDCDNLIKSASDSEQMLAHERLLIQCERTTPESLPSLLKQSCDEAADWLSDHGYKCFKDGHCEKHINFSSSGGLNWKPGAVSAQLKPGD